MDKVKAAKDVIPPEILASIEDLSAELKYISELIACLPGCAEDLPDVLPGAFCDTALH